MLIDKVAQEQNKSTLLRHHNTLPSLLEPMYNPVRPEIMNPNNRLAAGSGIQLGMTYEQADEERINLLQEKHLTNLILDLKSLGPDDM